VFRDAGTIIGTPWSPTSPRAAPEMKPSAISRATFQSKCSNNYSHIRMEAKRRALESIVPKPSPKAAVTAVSVPKVEPAAETVEAPGPGMGLIVN
jgi:hypothetical protein